MADGGGGGSSGGGGSVIAVLLGRSRAASSPAAWPLTQTQVRHPPSLGVIDTDGGLHIIDVTRALAHQLHTLMQVAGSPFDVGRLKSVWLTHAHVGHVDGVGLLGKEAMDARALSVHCSDSVAELFRATPAWNQLLLDERVRLAPVPTQAGVDDALITGVKVPHRAELSDTHAYVVSGVKKQLLYLPDHDSWRETLSAAGCDEGDVRGWLKKLGVDVAVIDGTFFDVKELPSGRQSTVPHPPVCETLKLLGTRQQGDSRVVFTHFNHTNPLLGGHIEARRCVEEAGWEIGEEGMTFVL
eukprot:jgi/Chlat1/6456/Chrsp45S06050